MRLTNTAEGGSNTTVVSDGNSGGGSGDAFTCTTNGSSLLTFSSAQAKTGNLSYKVGAGDSSVANYAYCGWDADSMGSGSTSLSVRLWFRTPSVAPTADNRFLSFKNTVTMSGLQFNGTGTANSFSVMQGTSGLSASRSPALSTSTWYRLELVVTAGVSSAGSYKFRIKNTSLADVHEYSAAFSTPNADAMYVLNVGRILTTANYENDVYFDDLTIGDSNDYLVDDTTQYTYGRHLLIGR